MTITSRLRRRLVTRPPCCAYHPASRCWVHARSVVSGVLTCIAWHRTVSSTTFAWGGVMRRFSLFIFRPAVPGARSRLAVAASLSALTLLAMAGCSSAASTSGPATAAPSSPTGQTYASKAFVVPLTVTVDASLKSPPILDSRNLLFWDAANSSANKVRFLVPTNLYRPNSSISEAPPKDYLKYLQGLTSQGLGLSNVVKITVDGHPATLMTATSNSADHGFFDGSLGCPNTGAVQDSGSLTGVAQGKGCFGIQPDLSLRLAVIPVDNTTLLAWARTSNPNPDEAFFAMFETMLKSVRFR